MFIEEIAMKSSSPGVEKQTPNGRGGKRGKVPKEKGARGKVLVPKGRIRLPRKAEGKVRRLMGAVRARVDGAGEERVRGLHRQRAHGS